MAPPRLSGVPNRLRDSVTSPEEILQTHALLARRPGDSRMASCQLSPQGLDDLLAGDALDGALQGDRHRSVGDVEGDHGRAHLTTRSGVEVVDEAPAVGDPDDDLVLDLHEAGGVVLLRLLAVVLARGEKPGILLTKDPRQDHRSLLHVIRAIGDRVPRVVEPRVGPDRLSPRPVGMKLQPQVLRGVRLTELVRTVEVHKLGQTPEPTQPLVEEVRESQCPATTPDRVEVEMGNEDRSLLDLGDLGVVARRRTRRVRLDVVRGGVETALDHHRAVLRLDGDLGRPILPDPRRGACLGRSTNDTHLRAHTFLYQIKSVTY